MSRFEYLQRETEPARLDFLAIPILRQATQAGVPLAIYLDFLGQAYHHVRHTCALLDRAAERCSPGQTWLRDAYRQYAEEERGHEEWILEDIDALGGDAAAASGASPRPPCERMVRQAYDAIDHDGPVSLLGMVFVLEGMSVLLAQRAASSIQERLRRDGNGGGFRYLTSHGALDRQHIAFYRTLVDRIEDDAEARLLVDSARTMYRLYGDLFRDIAARAGMGTHEA